MKSLFRYAFFGAILAFAGCSPIKDDNTGVVKSEEVVIELDAQIALNQAVDDVQKSQEKDYTVAQEPDKEVSDENDPEVEAENEPENETSEEQEF